MADRPVGGEAARTWPVYCGAYVGPVMLFTEMPECGTEFTFTDDDPVEPSRWALCPKCGAECEVLRG